MTQARDGTVPTEASTTHYTYVLGGTLQPVRRRVRACSVSSCSCSGSCASCSAATLKPDAPPDSIPDDPAPDPGRELDASDPLALRDMLVAPDPVPPDGPLSPSEPLRQEKQQRSVLI